MTPRYTPHFTLSQLHRQPVAVAFDAPDIVTDTGSDGRRFRLTGWAFDDVVEPLLWGAVDTTGQPVFTYLPMDQVNGSLSRPGRTLGRSSFMGEGVAAFSASCHSRNFGQSSIGKRARSNFSSSSSQARRATKVHCLESAAKKAASVASSSARGSCFPSGEL